MSESGNNVDLDGNIRWFVDNLLHRADGPAIIYTNGSEAWYQNGKVHREDGPAIIFSGGRREWISHDQYHRLDGPAIIWPSIARYAEWPEEWWVNGEVITERVFEWVRDNGLPDWRLWDDEIWVLFRMRFI